MATAILAVLRFVITRVWQFSKVGQSHKMGELDIETNVRWLIVGIISVPKITVSGHPLFKLLSKTYSHPLFET